jgi:membrane-associated phospholipid phosphatase
MPNQRSILVRTALTAAALVLLSILVLDGPLALTFSSVPDGAKKAISEGVRACEWLFGFRVSPYLYGGLLVLAGIAAKAWKHGTVGSSLVFIGLSHVTARFVTGVMKPPFSRLRPYEALADSTWHDTWFAAVGNSFPSGHAVHFWGLFFPLVVLFPKFWMPLAVLPVLISVARVVANDHYLSDVIASVAVAALITLAYSKMVLARGQAALVHEKATSLKQGLDVAQTHRGHPRRS